jgi:hypothetical protein
VITATFALPRFAREGPSVITSSSERDHLQWRFTR